jgi:transcriptional regulator with XRE-family HTH domain
MSQRFAENLRFVLKALFITRSQLAAELDVDKSIVGRWATGVVHPSAHNRSRLTALVARRVDGFTGFDWQRDPASLAELVGVDLEAVAADAAPTHAAGPAIPLIEAIMATTARRGDAYEGFYRSTRPHAQRPGKFLHDQVMVRRDESGLLKLRMAAGGVFIEGWVLLLHSQLFILAAELTSGALAFGILNGVNGRRANTLDGLTLNCALDTSRTPTASAIIFHRIGDLSGDREADDARFEEIAQIDPRASDSSAPEQIRRHLAGDFGPTPLEAGGEWLLNMPLSRSRSTVHLPE